MKPQASVLIIDEDAGFAASLKKELDAEGCDAAIVLRGEDGLASALQEPFDLVITGHLPSGLSGLHLVSQLHAVKPGLPIILMTADGSSKAAIDAARLGTFEYLLKPFEMPVLLALVAKALQGDDAPSTLLDLGAPISTRAVLVGRSPVMQALYREIGRAAQGSMIVLIRGETGTGKELVARAIHAHSRRACHPFVAMNCTAIPEGLLESELFGHERGAFTDAHARHIGCFEGAGNGTLLLDEVGELTPGTQAKLLRVLQEKSIQRLGGRHKTIVHVRVVAATHRDLETAMQTSQFRPDLFYRLNACTIRVPPLRERLEDIPDLVRHCLARFGPEVDVPAPAIQLDAVDFLRRQSWPGNVRELENVLQQALLLARNHPITLAQVQTAHARAARTVPAPVESITAYVATLLAQAQAGKIAHPHHLVMEHVEREFFTQVIQLAHGNQLKAAQWAGISRNTLHQKLVQFGLHPAAPGPATESENESTA
jgi:DNA-binding NtrC family response regulator